MSLDILEKDLMRLFPKCHKFKIKFLGEDFLLIGPSKQKGAIATEEQYENFLDSYAYLYPDGSILKYGLKIGTVEDIEFL